MVRMIAGVGLILLSTTLGSCVGPPLELIAELANAIEGQVYTATLSASDGAPTWTVTEGNLPPGLTLSNSTGEIAGTPTVPGAYDFKVRAQTFAPTRTGEDWYTIIVLPELTLSLNLPTARADVAYDYTPTITGGVAPYSVTVAGLPAGMAGAAANGRITGTPQFDYDGLTIEVTVVDSGTPQQTVTDRDTLVVKPTGVAITTESLESAPIGGAYSSTVSATGGKTPYSWSVDAGVLPDGLRLSSSTGVIAGTPEASAVTQTVTIKVTDADSPESTDERELKIVVPVAQLGVSLDDATVGADYDDALGAIGGTTPYTWSIVSGALPAGLTLDTTSGVISGTVEAGAQTQTFTVRVTDADSPATTDDAEFTIVVAP